MLRERLRIMFARTCDNEPRKSAADHNRYQAICADCGAKIDLPVKPLDIKPIRCGGCYARRRQAA